MPYLDNFSNLNEFDTENGIVVLKNVVSKLKETQQHFQYLANSESELRIKQEDFLKQLSETENSCRKILDGLIEKQAVQTLSLINSEQMISGFPINVNLSEAIEVFNIQTNLSDFSENFDRLESEYQRLKAVSKLSQQLTD